MDKKEMVKQMCDAFVGGRAALAEALGMRLTEFNNNLYEKNGCRFFSFDELERMQALSGTKCVADYFAQRAAAFVVAIPEEAELDTVELHHLSLNTDVRRGEVDHLIMSSISDDGCIDSEEEARILKKHRHHLAARDKEVKATIVVYRKN
jgi:hypothetical protein